MKAFALILGCVAVAACNSILGNEEGTRRQALADAGAADAAIRTAETCRADQKSCFGLCVSTNDTATGCGDPASCVACKVENADTQACGGEPGATTSVCKATSCRPGWADCNAEPGCESSLSRAETCGDCNTVCATPTPFCVYRNGTAVCDVACPNGTTQCGSSCIETSSDPLHCGSCAPCDDIASSSPRCENGSCTYECALGWHICGSACVPNDPSACGPACAKCPADAPHTIATCVLETCGTACEPGWKDCDGAAPGCETPAASACPDPLGGF